MNLLEGEADPYICLLAGVESHICLSMGVVEFHTVVLMERKEVRMNFWVG
jgi:hypothetical protein